MGYEGVLGVWSLVIAWYKSFGPEEGDNELLVCSTIYFIFYCKYCTCVSSD
jgi:hypothetical protein